MTRANTSPKRPKNITIRPTVRLLKKIDHALSVSGASYSEFICAVVSDFFDLQDPTMISSQLQEIKIRLRKIEERTDKTNWNLTLIARALLSKPSRVSAADAEDWVRKNLEV